jgi:hypothetical protein
MSDDDDAAHSTGTCRSGPTAGPDVERARRHALGHRGVELDLWNRERRPGPERRPRRPTDDERDRQRRRDEDRHHEEKDRGSAGPGLRLLPPHRSNVPTSAPPVVSRATPFVDTDLYTRAAAAAGSGRSSRPARDEIAAWVRLSADDPEPRVRAAALGAVVRNAGRTRAEQVWRRAATDSDPSVRRRAAELAPTVVVSLRPLLALLADPEWSVVEAAAWAVGEVQWSSTNRGRAVRALMDLTTGHDDPLVREAAVAALGAIGDPSGLPAVLHATHDRPAVRRRAVLALAPFEGPEVDAALEAALTDPDWQVRQAAEDLL